MAEAESYDDELFEDGFDERAAAEGVQTQLWRRLFRYTLAYPKELAIVAASSIACAATEAIYPLMTKWVVDDVLENGADASFVLWGALYVLCSLVLAVSIGAFVWGAGKVHAYTSHDIRQHAFGNLQRLSFSYYDYRPTGWLMARLTSDCNRLTDILAWAFLDVIWGVTMTCGIAVAMLVMHWPLALVVLAILPFVAWISAKFRKRILGSARLVRRTNSRITGNYNESIMGVVTSKAFVREEANAEDFGQLTDTMYRASVRNMVQAAVYVPLVMIFAAVAVNLALTFGGRFMLLGAIGAGTLIAFMMLVREFFNPITELAEWFAEMQMAQAAAERVLSLIDAKPEIEDSAQVRAALAQFEDAPRSAETAADGGAARIGEVELKGVSFFYEEQKPVLRHIDLKAKMGDTIAIVGPTGGGKSTLVNVICRFYEPTRGQVLIDGVDYRERSLHWLQSNLGMVLQNAHVFGGSIRENIRYGRLEATDQEVEWCAKLAGAHEFIEEMENGYDTEVGEGGGRLSAGQKQLVSFARAILAEPQILVMDEATSSVDTETELKIQQGLKFVLQGRISFVIAHRLSTIRNATRIVVVDDGRITETGDHAELMALGGHYATLYRQQSLDEATRDWGEDASGSEPDRPTRQPSSKAPPDQAHTA